MAMRMTILSEFGSFGEPGNESPLARYLVAGGAKCHRRLRMGHSGAIPGAMSAVILSILMLAGFALSIGGLYLTGWRRDAKRGGPMLAAAGGMLGDVAIQTMPVDERGARAHRAGHSGQSPP